MAQFCVLYGPWSRVLTYLPPIWILKWDALHHRNPHPESYLTNQIPSSNCIQTLLICLRWKLNSRYFDVCSSPALPEWHPVLRHQSVQNILMLSIVIGWRPTLSSNAAFLWCTFSQPLCLQDASHPFVHHALQVRRALALGDCMQVCLLYESAPNMGRALLDMVLPRVRLTGLKVLAKAYLPTLPVSTIASRLGFVPPPSPSSVAHPITLSTSALPGSTKATFAGKHHQGVSCIFQSTCRVYLVPVISPKFLIPAHFYLA